MTKDEFKKYLKIRNEVLALAERLKSMEDEVYSVRAVTVTGAPKSRRRGAATGDFSELLVKLMDLKGVYGQRLNELLDARKEIETLIEGLSGIERTLIRARYIDGLGWEGVAAELKCGRSDVFRVHAAILKKLR